MGEISSKIFSCSSLSWDTGAWKALLLRNQSSWTEECPVVRKREFSNYSMNTFHELLFTARYWDGYKACMQEDKVKTSGRWGQRKKQIFFFFLTRKLVALPALLPATLIFHLLKLFTLLFWPGMPLGHLAPSHPYVLVPVVSSSERSLITAVKGNHSTEIRFLS